MEKLNILLTGSTDGIGLEAAKILIEQGHNVVIHGRNKDKLNSIMQDISPFGGIIADLSSHKDTQRLAQEATEILGTIDVLINNAGVLKTNAQTSDGVDIRFTVNTIAPFLLTSYLEPSMNEGSRVVNLSSAAQALVNIRALSGDEQLGWFEAYAQSKTALNAWTKALADKKRDKNITFLAVNPGSLIATKMVKEGFGFSERSVESGAKIITEMATSSTPLEHNGEYYDNDTGSYKKILGEYLNDQSVKEIMELLKEKL